VESRKCRERRVTGAVVDEDGLPLVLEWVEGGGELVVEKGDRALLVANGDDDRDHTPRPYPPGTDSVVDVETVVGTVVVAGVVVDVVCRVVGGGGGGVAVVVCSVVVCSVVVCSVVSGVVVVEVDDAVVGAVRVVVRRRVWPRAVCVWLVDDGPGELEREAMRPAVTPATARRSAAIAARSAVGRRRRGGSGGRRPGRTLVCVSSHVSPCRSSRRRAPPSGGRACGSLASIESVSCARCAGASGRTLLTGGAGASRWRAASCSGSSASNGSRPVSIRKRITPNE
jgi:hypothetical protein